MPTPIIELQRRLSNGGAIRIGGEKQPNRPGPKLEAFRLTSQQRELVEQAAKLYGGNVTQWQSPVGAEWQVYTEAAELPVLVMPDYSLRQTYELWEGATKRERVCDGFEMDDGHPCICNAEGVDRCDIYTRVVVALPELDTALGWQLITKGANAAHELPGMFALINRISGGASFVPARLRIDQRRSVDRETQQVRRFVVPVLDIGVGYAALAAGSTQAALAAAPEPSTFTPVAARSAGVAEALESVPAAPSGAGMGGNQPDLPRPSVADFQPQPAPTPQPSGEQPPGEQPYTEQRQTMALSEPQRDALNALVGELRDRGKHITTRQLWESIAGLRSIDADTMIALLGGVEADGELHWSPLRDSLQRPEASQLIDWLKAKQQRVTQEAVA